MRQRYLHTTFKDLSLGWNVPKLQLFKTNYCYSAEEQHIVITEKPFKVQSKSIGYHQFIRSSEDTVMGQTKHDFRWFLFLKWNLRKIIININKAVSFSKILLTNTITHELGHTLAHPHAEDKHDVMHWDMVYCSKELCPPSEKNIQVFLRAFAATHNWPGYFDYCTTMSSNPHCYEFENKDDVSK